MERVDLCVCLEKDKSTVLKKLRLISYVVWESNAFKFVFVIWEGGGDVMLMKANVDVSVNEKPIRQLVYTMINGLLLSLSSHNSPLLKLRKLVNFNRIINFTIEFTIFISSLKTVFCVWCLLSRGVLQLYSRYCLKI